MRGRPRDPSVDTAIAAAAADVLQRRGYRGTTVRAVAAQAGVSEPTVYLRYPTKGDLAMAGIAHLPLLAEPPDTGDAFDDLTAMLSDILTTAEAVGLTLAGTVLAQEDEHPELLEHWRATVGVAFRSAVGRIVERGRRRGQLKVGVSGQLVADLLLGPYLAHYTIRGRPPRGWARTVIETLR